MTKRKVTHLVDQAMLECHSEEHMRELLTKPYELPMELQREDRRELDEAVFELLGIKEKRTRAKLLKEIYETTTEYYRYQRTQDMQAMEDRAGASRKRIGALDLAASAWDSLAKELKDHSLLVTMKSWPGDRQTINIPEGKGRALGSGHMFEPSTVIFSVGKDKKQVSYESAEQTELVELLAQLDSRGKVEVPHEAVTCKDWKQKIQEQLKQIENQCEKLTGSRTGNEKLQEQGVSLLRQWFIHRRR